jgi:hypothetical protein
MILLYLQTTANQSSSSRLYTGRPRINVFCKVTVSHAIWKRNKALQAKADVYAAWINRKAPLSRRFIAILRCEYAGDGQFVELAVVPPILEALMKKVPPEISHDRVPHKNVADRNFASRQMGPLSS